MNKEYITVFGQKLAGWLMVQGFPLKDMRPDRDGSGRNLFFFKNSEEIHQKMREYKEKYQ